MRERHRSSTALVIAKSTLITASDLELQPLVSDGAREVSAWFVRDHARDHLLLQWAWYRTWVAQLYGWVLPGIAIHYAARKKVVRASVEAAIEAGSEQVVVIAAGFDTLAYCLHRRHPGVRFFELDHPATQASKRQSLLTHGTMGESLRLHSVDLTRTSLAEGLAQAGVSRQSSSVVVAEGLLMYLLSEQVEAFIGAIAGFFSADVQLALTFMVPDARGRLRFHNGSWLLDVWLRGAKEPFLSGFTDAQMLELLGRHDFDRAELWAHERLRADALPPELRRLPLAIGEHICVARRSRGSSE